MTPDDEASIVREILAEMNLKSGNAAINYLLALPGVYEVVREDLNNEILDRLAAEQGLSEGEE